MEAPEFVSFIPRKFRPESITRIAQANALIEEYADQGYDLTLRQLYYRFVAAGYIPNSQKSYDNLGALINDARLSGNIPWNRITDRTRNVRGGGGWDSPESIVSAVTRQYQRDLWEGQKVYIEVWVEKEALANVVERACARLNMPYFSCRGYVSQSEMYAAHARFAARTEEGNARDGIVLHLGDHDPSGLDMTRDIEDRLNLFAWGEPWDDGRGPVYTVRRIALNMDQVRERNLPPNPAKTTDARFKAYRNRYGDESWELDALEPAELDNLITTTVKSYLDTTIWGAQVGRMETERAQLRRVSRNWGVVNDLLDDNGVTL